jgi:hypothetical protein
VRWIGIRWYVLPAQEERTTRIRLSTMLAMTADRTNNRLEFQARDAQSQVFCIEIPEAMLGGFIVALNSQAGQLRGSGGGQPMTLNSGRPFTIADGRVGLELTLDNGFRLPVLFPKEAIPILRSTLDELERLSKQAPGARRPQ